MNKFFKRTILSLAVAATMCVGACGLAACNNDGGEQEGENPPVTQPEVTAAFKFSGSTEKNGKTYNVSLSGYDKDGTIEIDTGVSGAAKVGGYYFYTEHKGYAFILKDNAGTALTSTYNATKKQHEVVYHLALGDDGEADVTLALSDADFTATSDKANFYSGSFKGSIEFAPITDTLTLKLNENGTCEISATHPVFAGFCNTTGTYTLENNVFNFTIADKDQGEGKQPAQTTINGCTFNPVTGTYTLQYSVYNPNNNATVTSTLTYTPEKTLPQKATALKGKVGNTDITAFFLSGGGIRIDQVGANGSIISESAAEYTENLDNTGKYYFINGQYIVVMEHGVFASTYKDGEYTLDYTFAAGDKVTLKGAALTGLVLEDTKPVGSFGDINVTLYFTDETNCVVDVSAKLASFASMLDKKGTYVVNNDGTITVTVTSQGQGGATTADYTISYNATTESFSMTAYTVSGQDASVDMILTGSLWAD